MLTALRSLLLICLLAVAVQPAAAAGRQALVIGIDDYEELPKLNKAVGDARAMADKLRELGFEVTEAINPDRRALNRDLSAFARRLSSGDVALVHFSGHGIEIEGQNYLLPSDAPKPESGNSAFVKSEALAMGDLIRQVAESGAGTRVFIIDACRDNPFQQSGVRSVGGTRGLARVEAPAGTLILYSAGYGQTALDRLGDSDPEPTSVYTRVLLEKMGEPGVKLRDVAVEVRKEVEELARGVGHDQRPAYYDELSSDIALVEGGAVPQPKPRKEPAATTDNSVELAYWDSIKDSKNPAMLQSYLRKYPNGQFADLANIMLEGLKGEEDAERAQREADRLRHEQELAAIRAEAERLKAEAELEAIRKEAERLQQQARANDSRATPPEPQQRYHYIVGLDPNGDNWLALKAKPDIKSKRLRKMGPETLLIVTGQQGNWVRVRLMDGTEGWASGKYIACCTTLN